MNLKRVIFFTCAFASISGLLGTANASKPTPTKSANSYYYDDFNDYNNGNYDYDYPSDKPLRLSKELTRRYTGTNIIKIRQQLGINREYRGYKLKRVILIARTDVGRGKASLLINREEVQRKVVGVNFQRIKFAPFPGEEIIGQDIRTLQFKLRGNFDVKKIIAILEPPRRRGQPRTRRLQQDLQRNYDGEQMLMVRNLLGMNRNFNGQRVLKVMLVASSEYGYGHATLLINNRQVGATQRLGTYNGHFEFLIPRNMQVLGQNIRTIKIRLQGNIFVTTLQAIISNRATNDDYDDNYDDDYGTNPNTYYQLSTRLHREVYANSSLRLVNLLHPTYDQAQQTVRSIFIDVQAGIRGELKICTTGYYQTCTRGVLVRGQQQVRFDLQKQHSLNKVLLVSQGTMTITKIKIIF